MRAIADPYDRAVPQAALEALRPDGRVRALAPRLGQPLRPRPAVLRLHALMLGAHRRARR